MATTKVTTGGITDATIATADIADSAVATAKIADDAITTAKIAANAIGAGEINNGSITSVELADGAVPEAKLATDSVTTAKIADQAVTLAKLPHGDGSSDGKFLRANNGADPTFESLPASGLSNIVEDTSPQLGGDLATNSNDILFADNDKAVFGAGNDMELRHESSSSDSFIMHQNENGHLRILSGVNGNGGIKLMNRINNESYIECDSDAGVELYHDNSKKIESTSTGATVTGTVAQTVLPSWSLRPNASSDIAGFPHSNMGHTIGWSADTTGASAKACHLSGGCTLGPFTGSPVGNGFNIGGSTVGKLTVPLAGKYSVWVKIRAEVAWSTGYLKMFVNGTQVAAERTINFNSSDQKPHSLGPMVLDLAANDYIEIVIEANIPSNGFSGYNKKYNWFTGHYIG